MLKKYADLLKKQLNICNDDHLSDTEKLKNLLKYSITSTELLKNSDILWNFASQYPQDVIIGKQTDVTIIKEGSVYKIHFDGLLPPRMDYKSLDTETLKKLRLEQSVRFRTAVHNFDDRINIPEFNFFYMLIVNNYSQEDKNKDPDNLDTKIFVDNMISGVFIPDDSFENISYIMHSRPSKKSSTDIYVGEIMDVMSVWSNLVTEQ